MEISGLETIDEFNDYLNKCGHYGINVLKYDKCYVGNETFLLKKLSKITLRSEVYSGIVRETASILPVMFEYLDVIQVRSFISFFFITI